MQIKLIETYLAVSNLQGFHAAARALNITQTAVSARIKSLESAMGMSLFERDAKGAQLTEFGKQFKPFAEQLVQTWRYATAQLPQQFEKRTAVRLGAQLSIWDLLLVDLSIWLEQTSGEVMFTLNFDHNLSISEAIKSQLLDIAITSEKIKGSQINCLQLSDEKLILVSNQALSLGNDVLPLFINLELGDEYNFRVKEILPQTQRQQIFLGNSSMALRYLLKRGGVGYFPKAMIQDYLHNGQLLIVANAQEIALPCYILTAKQSPVSQMTQQITKGLKALRG